MKHIYLLSLLVLLGCDSANDLGYTNQIVLQGFLYANEPVDSVIVRSTIPLNASGDDDRLSSAIVTISWQDSTLHFVESRIKGRYLPQSVIEPRPGVQYTLHVAALGQEATSSTTIPQPIHLDSAKLGTRVLSLLNSDDILYPTHTDSFSTPGIHLWWSPSLGCAGYGLEAISVDTTSDFIHDDLDSQLPDSLGFGRYRYFIYSTDEQIVWLQYQYFGPNELRVLALDQNYQDYVLGLYLSGSQFNNNTLHVTNGLGVFGSAARAKKKVFIK